MALWREYLEERRIARWIREMRCLRCGDEMMREGDLWRLVCGCSPVVGPPPGIREIISALQDRERTRKSRDVRIEIR